MNPPKKARVKPQASNLMKPEISQDWQGCHLISLCHHISYFLLFESQTTQDLVSVQGAPKCLQMVLPPVAMEIQPKQCSLWAVWLGIWVKTKR